MESRRKRRRCRSPDLTNHLDHVCAVPHHYHPFVEIDVGPFYARTLDPSKIGVDHEREHELVPDPGVGRSLLYDFEQALDFFRGQVIWIEFVGNLERWYLRARVFLEVSLLVEPLR